ncbi:IQ domain-containing protein H isoform X2 [Hemicordylus capensis]|uniref:IQ domain-containing protein H isoform X2 n=1 Tax=Hemicordylus capensis TaxID=884348 RepID=UPI00230240CC|nr:IQ domain-containing protein H isoform X2 [Hemicordylus capensis]
MAEESKPGGQIGAALAQVQEDLQKLKEKLQDASHDWEEVAIQSLEAAIERTESELRKHAEKYLNAINKSVLTISSIDNVDLCSRQISRWGIPLETSQKEIIFPEMSAIVRRGGKPSLQMSSGSKHKLSMVMKIMCNPRNDCHRRLVNENYGVNLPLIPRRETAPAPTQKVAKGVTMDNLLVAPPTHRGSRVLLPLAESDARRGILNLIERGLIPRAARITLEKPPVLPKPAPLHEFHTKHKKGVESQKAGVRPLSHTKPASSHSHTSRGSKGSKGSIAPPPSCISVVSPKKSKQQLVPVTQKQEPPTSDWLSKKSPEISPGQEFQNALLDFDIPVCKGAIDREASIFLGFKHHCCLFWGSVLSFLEHVERLLKDYAVPSATIQGRKVMEILPDFELDQRPTREELLSVLKNYSTVKMLLSQPGQRYKGQNGTQAAATKIQATWRCYKFRKAYITFRQQQWASGVIAISWLVRVHMARVRKALKEARQRHLENFNTRVKHLAANWNRIRTSRRTIIHIPSLGYSQLIREASPDFTIHQGSQFGRLCEIQDSNVDVIYVCPLQTSEELRRYYHKLLGLQAAVRSGNPKDMADLQDRFKILTPEAINSFPNRPLSLATLLKYSPKTIKRIRNLIQGKEAYMVGGLLHQDDLEVADALDVPIFGSAPEVAHLYSSKSGSKRVFAAAGVPMPPGQYDIYSRPQVFEVLSQLILDYPEVKRWVFKMDHDYAGNGTAYCDIIDHLRCYPWVQKEIHRYGPEIWKSKWAHEPALAKISQELPGLLAQHAQAVNEKRFPTWGKFLQTFVSQGGVIEAFPPSDSVTNLTVDMLIEPTGEISMVSSGDQIHADGPFRSSGTTFPQASVESRVLNLLCSKIGEACKSRGVVGYFSIDFVTFIHPQTRGQQVWAIDLDLHYSDHLALTRILLYVTNGTLDCSLSRFSVQIIPKKPKGHHPPEEEPQTPPTVSRYVVMSSSMRHINLSIIYYNVFLQMCKAHGIGYDVQQKEGTLFTLFEDQKRHIFGMLTIGEHLQGVLMTFARHLFIIYQELSAPNMHAETNFKGAVQEIETILGVTEQNKLKFEEEEEQAAKAQASTK